MSEAGKTIRGIAAAPGVAVGRAHVLAPGGHMPPQRRVDDVEREVDRLRNAIDASRAELEEIRDRSGEGDAGATFRTILDAHLTMHRDELLVAGAEREIRTRSINAEWALRAVIDDVCGKLRAADDAYFRERAGDVESVGERILRGLTGRASQIPRAPGGVLIATDLGPGDAAELGRAQIEGLVLERGSPTSHTAILARALGIPAIVGAPGVVALVANGDTVVVDAIRGEVIPSPDAEQKKRGEQRMRRYRRYTKRLRQKRGTAATTRDGEPVTLTANVELPAEAVLAAEEGAGGVGLYRTEYLFLAQRTPPSEDEQHKVYADVLRAMAPRPVVFRTFDLGADKLAGHESWARSQNPALGLRGLRFSLAREDLFRSQLRALLRAAQDGDARVMLPMVAGLADLRRARALLDSEAASLAEAGVPHRRVALGVMIELPSAVAVADRLAKEADFFSVGTNDLVQYTLAVDRTDSALASLARAWDPAVLRLLRDTERAAAAAGIPLSMCGDLAGDPFALPLVLGLGYRSLSMPFSQIAVAREAIMCIDAGEARAAATEALDAATPEEVEAIVRTRFAEALEEVWAEQGVA